MCTSRVTLRRASTPAQSCVTADGKQLSSVPVKVSVLPFTLPDEIAMRSNFGGLGGGLARHLGHGARLPKSLPRSRTSTSIRCSLTARSLRHWETSGPQWTPEGGIDDSRTGPRMRAMVEDRHVNALCVPFAYRDEPEKCKAYLHDLAAYLRSKGWLELGPTSTWKTSPIMRSNTRPCGIRVN